MRGLSFFTKFVDGKDVNLVWKGYNKLEAVNDKRVALYRQIDNEKIKEEKETR